MTIDEAIKHAEEVAEEHESDLKVYENLGKDRELFKKEENNCKECGEQHRQLAEWLKKLKQLREQPRWIPVSERLPEESLNSVIGWDTYRERCVFVQYIDGHFQIMGRDECFDIVAWMPLPEPYKAEMKSEL